MPAPNGPQGLCHLDETCIRRELCQMRCLSQITFIEDCPEAGVVMCRRESMVWTYTAWQMADRHMKKRRYQGKPRGNGQTAAARCSTVLAAKASVSHHLPSSASQEEPSATTSPRAGGHQALWRHDTPSPPETQKGGTGHVWATESSSNKTRNLNSVRALHRQAAAAGLRAGLRAACSRVIRKRWPREGRPP